MTKKAGKAGTSIRSSQFVSVKDTEEKFPGLPGDTVFMVAGFTEAPESREDPYLFRKHAMLLRMNGDTLEVPNKNNEFSSYAIALRPGEVEPVDAGTQLMLEEKVREQYGEQPQAEEEGV